MKKNNIFNKQSVIKDNTEAGSSDNNIIMKLFLLIVYFFHGSIQSFIHTN